MCVATKCQVHRHNFPWPMLEFIVILDNLSLAGILCKSIERKAATLAFGQKCNRIVLVNCERKSYQMPIKRLRYAMVAQPL